MHVWIMMLVLVLSAPVAALSMNPPLQSDLALIVVPPWADPARILAAVEGHEVSPRRAPVGLLVQTNRHDAAYAAGALWVGNGRVLSVFCGAEP